MFRNLLQNFRIYCYRDFNACYFLPTIIFRVNNPYKFISLCFLRGCIQVVF